MKLLSCGRRSGWLWHSMPCRKGARLAAKPIDSNAMTLAAHHAICFIRWRCAQRVQGPIQPLPPASAIRLPSAPCLPIARAPWSRHRRALDGRDVAQPGSASHWGCGGSEVRILSSRPIFAEEAFAVSDEHPAGASVRTPKPNTHFPTRTFLVTWLAPSIPEGVNSCPFSSP